MRNREWKISVFLKRQNPPLKRRYRLLFGDANKNDFYYLRSSGFRVISLAGIKTAPNFLRISVPYRKLNTWCGDWLFSFFLV
jgi:hypothetical protein